jgi:hypothetical protein
MTLPAPTTRSCLTDVDELLRTANMDHRRSRHRLRWVRRFTAEFIEAARPCRGLSADRWFVDETSFRISGWWTSYLRSRRQAQERQGARPGASKPTECATAQHLAVERGPELWVDAALHEQAERHEVQPNGLDLLWPVGSWVLGGVGVDDDLVERHSLRRGVVRRKHLAERPPAAGAARHVAVDRSVDRREHPSATLAHQGPEHVPGGPLVEHGQTVSPPGTENGT